MTENELRGATRRPKRKCMALCSACLEAQALDSRGWKKSAGFYKKIRQLTAV